MNHFVDNDGRWVYEGNPTTGIQVLAQRQTPTPILDLSNVLLTRLPKELAKINGLEELYLHNNQLTTLPDNLGHISKLRLLSLGRNQLSSLPDSMRERWNTFETLYLGDNKFTQNPVDEDWMTMFKQGSVGSNPIPEPISPFWMTKQDAREFPVRLSLLFLHAETDSSIRQQLQDQAIQLLLGCPEPMIYEIMLQGVWIEDVDDLSSFHWNEFLSNPIHHPLRNVLLRSIPRGSMVHSSLLRYHSSLLLDTP